MIKAVRDRKWRRTRKPRCSARGGARKMKECPQQFILLGEDKIGSFSNICQILIFGLKTINHGQQ